MITCHPERSRKLEGIWSAALTPIDTEFCPDASRAALFYRDLLQCGCDGINVLGTTGEAMSFSAKQRVDFMEALASSGLPMQRMMVGTGAAALGDAVRLMQAALVCNYSAALVMPPYFYRDVTDDGIVAFFEALFSRTKPPRKSVLLYNFPMMSGITFHSALVDRLVDEFPETIAGMKDSSNDANLQAEVLAHHPELAIFPGSESDLLAAKARGAAGCVSGSVALWPQLAHAVFTNGDEALAGELTRRRAALEGVPFVPAMRYLIGSLRGDSAWERAMPSQAPLTSAQRRTIDAAVEPFRKSFINAANTR
jgi:4-hydroxy-tetrahydrodipicolinate synthase